MDGGKQGAAADQAAGDGSLNAAREGTAADTAAGGGATGQAAAGDDQAGGQAAAGDAAAQEAKAAALAAAAQVEGRAVVLYTQFGPIKVKLLEQLAPRTTALVWQLAQARGCKDCAFYRCALQRLVLRVARMRQLRRRRCWGPAVCLACPAGLATLFCCRHAANPHCPGLLPCSAPCCGCCATEAAAAHAPGLMSEHVDLLPHPAWQE